MGIPHWSHTTQIMLHAKFIHIAVQFTYIPYMCIKINLCLALRTGYG